ncbi:succinate dehydrogenase assembly factor 2-A, mitochondrial-like [Anthonomus grandis grandis]|uniref:succinate dehydrogenase assembly factor 2-A, mitochondrial-like n=1 Tax=Anthonomus grandis grandis TaxID=2921223 RepID=UPI002165EFC1|nr:succinate dehydrogenase assembly factor 2-A, mitochondrial-like [Anthonomus grandis grandis]
MNYLKTLGLTKTVAPNFRILTRLCSGNVIHPSDEPVIEIPRPKSRDNETMAQRKSRLVYQSRKRGMLENDLLLSTFIDKYLEGFNEQQTNLYDRLINGPSNDWDIYYWASDIKEIPPEFDSEVMQLLRLHCKNLNKESRLRQPDLK